MNRLIASLLLLLAASAPVVAQAVRGSLPVSPVPALALPRLALPGLHAWPQPATPAMPVLSLAEALPVLSRVFGLPPAAQAAPARAEALVPVRPVSELIRVVRRTFELDGPEPEDGGRAFDGGRRREGEPARAVRSQTLPEHDLEHELGLR